MHWIDIYFAGCKFWKTFFTCNFFLTVVYIYAAPKARALQKSSENEYTRINSMNLTVYYIIEKKKTSIKTTTSQYIWKGPKISNEPCIIQVVSNAQQ